MDTRTRKKKLLNGEIKDDLAKSDRAMFSFLKRLSIGFPTLHANLITLSTQIELFCSCRLNYVIHAN